MSLVEEWGVGDGLPEDVVSLAASWDGQSVHVAQTGLKFGAGHFSMGDGTTHDYVLHHLLPLRPGDPPIPRRRRLLRAHVVGRHRLAVFALTEVRGQALLALFTLPFCPAQRRLVGRMHLVGQPVRLRHDDPDSPLLASQADGDLVWAVLRHGKAPSAPRRLCRFDTAKGTFASRPLPEGAFSGPPSLLFVVAEEVVELVEVAHSSAADSPGVLAKARCAKWAALDEVSERHLLPDGAAGEAGLGLPGWATEESVALEVFLDSLWLCRAAGHLELWRLRMGPGDWQWTKRVFQREVPLFGPKMDVTPSGRVLVAGRTEAEGDFESQKLLRFWALPVPSLAALACDAVAKACPHARLLPDQRLNDLGVPRSLIAWL